jgi:hypothetical protein
MIVLFWGLVVMSKMIVLFWSLIVMSKMIVLFWALVVMSKMIVLFWDLVVMSRMIVLFWGLLVMSKMIVLFWGLLVMCSHCPFIHHEGLQSFQHSFPCHVFKLYLIVLALIHNYMNLKILCKLYMSCIYGADKKSNSTCHVIMVLTRNQTLHVMYLWC